MQLIFLPTSSLLASQGSRQVALQRLLAVGRHKRRRQPISALLCRLMGVSQQTDWPIAALSWLGEGNPPGADYWLCADPVHLILQRDHLSLDEPVPLALSQQDAYSLLATLNRHFADYGLQFELGDSGCCYLRLPKPPAITTTAPETAMGRDISAYLPQGRDAARWSQIINEIQMLLHAHAINEARERSGELPVNSLWLSGGGILPARGASNITGIFADQPLAKGLAALAQVPHFGMPVNADALVAEPRGNVLLVLDNAHDAERVWFQPLLTALAARKMGELILHFAVRDQVLSVNITPMDLWKFWRKSAPVESYFMAHM